MLKIPNHIAIIMDGNGRWAKKRYLPRVVGHTRGVKRVKDIVEHCIELKIKYLTLFAFGRDNWFRPTEEVTFLMKLLSNQITKEFNKLHTQGIKIRFIGDRSRIQTEIVDQIKQIEEETYDNKILHLNIALDYSGKYDIVQAINKILNQKEYKIITEEIFEKYLLTYPNPHPDLFIRTSGEIRLSNFMLWQLSYSECYFTDTYWPDFNKKCFDEAIKWYSSRERRYGRITEQLMSE